MPKYAILTCRSCSLALPAFAANEQLEIRVVDKETGSRWRRGCT